MQNIVYQHDKSKYYDRFLIKSRRREKPNEARQPT
jgi:hypothetical protein